MNRTLRRPMFRIGGSAEGITSGLQPRQGYNTNKNNLVEQNDYSKMNVGDFLKTATMGDIEDFVKSKQYKPKTNVWDYIGEIGLDLMSRPTTGNIVSDIGTSMREPYSRYIQRKGSAAEQEYASGADLFETMLGAQAKVLAAEAEGKGGPEWQKQWEIEQIPILMDEIATLNDIKERTKEQDLALAKAEAKLEKIKGTDLAVEWFLGPGKEVGANALFKKTKLDLLKEDNIAGGEKYKGNEESPELIADTFVAFRKYVKELKADGGRVGYALAGSVMGAGDTQEPQPGERSYEELRVAGQRQGPMDQGTAPEDTAGITYEELRARLPQEVTDDIVRLLANSAEALEDFAMIQTEQDINIFNKKYGVNLVLPSEG